MQPILEIKKISKKFRVYHERQPYLSLRESISKKIKSSFSLWRNTGRKSEDFWALQDISFDVYAGESIGIIGKNGAGKSTLLKILSKITPPTEGKIISRGRMASLLEVGTGFHPELTGRENIFLNGSILGMKKKEIQKKFDEIVNFSGVEKFLDTPLKHYSSGMQLRLAFSVAAFLEPEILLIDEVLAVGDAEFQRKCLGKMDDVTRKEGRTVLFVSHNMWAIERLCNKCLYLKNGFMVNYGNTTEVVQQYLRSETSEMPQKYFERNNSLGDNIVKLLSVRLLDAEGNCKYIYDYSSEIFIEVTFILYENNCPYLNLHVHSISGEKLFIIIQEEDARPKSKGKYSIVAKIPPEMLNMGKYYIGVAFTTHTPFTIHLYDEYCVFFEISENTFSRKHPFKDKLPGFFNPKITWKLSEL